MVTYIYFVKCPNCEDEHFDFFDDAKAFALGCLSQKPVITQTEVCRNDFGECTDHSDLGTIWSWEDECADTEGGYTDAEPTKSIFTKDDLKRMADGQDPEFDDDDFFFNNSLVEDAARRISFKNTADYDEFIKLCKEIGIFTGADLNRFMNDAEADDGNLLDKLRAYKDELGDDFKLKEARTPTAWDITPKNPVMIATRAPKDSDYVIVLKHPKTNKHYVFSRSFALTSDINKAMPYSSKFEAEDDIKYAEDAIDQRGFNFAQPETLGYDSYDYGRVRFARTNPENYYDEYRSANFFVATAAEAKKLPGIKDNTQPQDSFRKPIPEGMTIEQLVEEMEMNEELIAEKELDVLVRDSINHLVNDLGKDPNTEDFADDVILDLERNYDIFVPELPESHRKWADAIAGEVSRQLNNQLQLDEELRPKTWICEFDGREIGTVEASTEEEAYEAMEREYPEYHYGLYDGVGIVYPADEDELDENVKEIHDLGNEYDGGYPTETPEVSDSHLKLCPECGKEAFDIETGICVECGFN